jgi:hypothetical protein
VHALFQVVSQLIKNGKLILPTDMRLFPILNFLEEIKILLKEVMTWKYTLEQHSVERLQIQETKYGKLILVTLP